MTFDRPEWLLASLLAPLAWGIGRLRERRVEVVVGSLLLYRRALARLGEPSASERRRPLDRRTLAEMAFVALVGLGAAGPRAGAETARPSLAIVLDTSPSMRAAGRPEAVAAALDHLGAGRGRSPLGGGEPPSVIETSGAPPGAANPLAFCAQAARAAGARVVVAITDHAISRDGSAQPPPLAGPPRAGAVPGAGADLIDATLVVRGRGLRNRGIVAAGALGGRLLVRVGGGAGRPTDAILVARIGPDGVPAGDVARGGGDELRADLPADLGGGGRASAGSDAIGASERTAATLMSSLVLGEADGFPDDDRARLEAPGSPVPVAIAGERSAPLRRAIEAAGGRTEDPDAEGTAPGGWARAPLRVVVATRAGPGEPPLRLIPRRQADFPHTDLGDVRVHAAPPPPPPWLAEALVPLAVDEAGRVLVGFTKGGGDDADPGTITPDRPRQDPGPVTLWLGCPLDPAMGATDLPTRRAFPVLIAEALALATRESGARAPRGAWRVRGLLAPQETLEADDTAPRAAGFTRVTGDVGFEGAADVARAIQEAKARAELRVADAGASLASAFAGVAALVALGAWRMGRDRRLA